jgi:glycosyltransferase involved in cell wall biosynthesis
MASPPITVVILTQNEEKNIEPCLASVASFADVHVLDSGSTDATVDRATRGGAMVHTNPFVSFGNQRNWAIDHIPARYLWTLHLDADERMTPELAAEMEGVLAADPPLGGYYIPSKLMFAGRWLKYAGDYPTYQVRLFRKDRLRFVDYGHGQRESTTNGLGRLRQPYLHYAFSKGLEHWFAKHAVYARQEALQATQEIARGGRPQLRDLFGSDSTKRRRLLKQMAYRLPCRYLFRLLYLLTVKWAFLDGAAGVTYAHMIATYEGMMEVHLRLLRNGIEP